VDQSVQAPLSRKRISISRTVSDLTGKIQSAGVEKQPGVEHLRCKARRPLVPPTTSIWRPETTLLQEAFEAEAESAREADRQIRWCNRVGHRGTSMVGFYRSVAKPRVYLLLSVGLAVREESRRRRWQIQSRFARTKQSRNERERVSRHALTFMLYALHTLHL
jgi:hypothetical protein